MYSRNFTELIKRAYRREGARYVVGNGIRFVLNSISSNLSYWYHKCFFRDRTFEFRGKEYKYYFHPRGKTWMTERSVEIPLVWELVQEYRQLNKKILEVGNVLSYRFETNHDILDKYEMVPGVINEDVISFVPDHKYDLIVSISTMEHVGWDEIPTDPHKLLEGLNNLKNMLSPTGKLLVTLPLGQNAYLDDLLRKNVKIFDEQFYLLKKSDLNWKEEVWDNLLNITYNEKIPAANAILVGISMKSGGTGTSV